MNEMVGTIFDMKVETAREMRGMLAPGTRARYALAGRAIITARSTRTGERFTYKITRPADADDKWFVGLLSGPDNWSDYAYIGMISGADKKFQLTKRSRAGADAPSVIAIEWLCRNWEDARVEVWHEGSCGRCGRRLTVPESIASGIGPTCAGYAR